MRKAFISEALELGIFAITLYELPLVFTGC